MASFSGSRMVQAFSLGLLMQALLSASNFLVGLILIRRTSDLQYSYYVLATNTLLLLTSLQTSFIQPYIVSCITHRAPPERRNLIGALVRGNGRWLPPACLAGLLLVFLAWELNDVPAQTALLLAACLFAGATALVRELFRVTLFAYRRPVEVLKGDAAYVILLVSGAFAATLLPDPAVWAIVFLSVASLTAGLIVRWGLWRHESWNAASDTPVLKEMAAWGRWAVLGSGIHWLLIQGYGYLVAGVLNVQDVAAIAATRLTLVPVFVLSGGVSMLLFPITSRWVRDLGTAVAARRLVLLVAALGAAAIAYMVLLWWCRDWLFSTVLKKQFAQRDGLLLLWSAVFLVTLCRDQLATLTAARGRFREMTLVTCFSAVMWLICSWWAMSRFGPQGAVAGILVGETLNILGIIVMIARDARQPTLTAPAAH